MIIWNGEIVFGNSWNLLRAVGALLIERDGEGEVAEVLHGLDHDVIRPGVGILGTNAGIFTGNK